MLIYGLMKFTEYIPFMYDTAMNVMTFGNHSKAHQVLTSEITKGKKVLDIGCGTGDISLKCAQAGAEVWSVDASPQMLNVFKGKLKGNPWEKNIRIIESGAGSLKSVLGDEKFDIIIMSLMLGELPKVVRQQALKSASELIKDNGTIIISDELWPENPVVSAIYYVLFAIFFVPNFLLTRTLIRPVKNLRADVERNNLRIKEKRSLFMGIITIWKVARA